MGKNVLVAGGLGFIGSHLCARLLKEGSNVICLDNLLTGQIGNLHALNVYPGFEYRKWDITNPVKIEVAIDEIYNFASPASPVQCQKDPINDERNSVIHT